MKIREDIHVGRATVKAHADGGWALPGGEVTDDIAVATGVAAGLSQQLGTMAFAEENRKALIALRAAQGASTGPTRYPSPEN